MSILTLPIWACEHMTKPTAVTFYFGDEARCREFFESMNAVESLMDCGIQSWRLSFCEGSALRQSLRRNLLRTMIYIEWAKRGSVTAKTKLGRRTALRQRVENAFARLFPGDKERWARYIDALFPIAVGPEEHIKSVRPSLVVAATDIYRSQEV